MRKAPQENTGRVVALALGFFGGLALLGWTQGVFARLSAETSLALGLFALGFAIATYALDASVRGWVRGLWRAPRMPRVRKAPAKSPVGTRAAT